jgi:hypothetical protein
MSMTSFEINGSSKLTIFDLSTTTTLAQPNPCRSKSNVVNLSNDPLFRLNLIGSIPGGIWLLVTLGAQTALSNDGTELRCQVDRDRCIRVTTA